jgi:hypothetical protein
MLENGFRTEDEASLRCLPINFDQNLRDKFKPTLTSAADTRTLIKKRKSGINATKIKFLRHKTTKTRKDRLKNKEMRNRLLLDKLQEDLKKYTSVVLPCEGNKRRQIAHHNNRTEI